MGDSSFSIFISHGQLAVFDPSLKDPFNDWSHRHSEQGFTWRPGSVSFATIVDGGDHLVTVAIGALEDQPSAGAVRVIDVPFKVPERGTVEVASIADSRFVELPSGGYRLRFECFQPTDSAASVRLLFANDENPVFRLVRADELLHPGPDLLLMASPA